MDALTLTYSDAVALIPKASDLDNAAVAFIEAQDYYQKGKQYTGPKPAADDPEGQEYLDQSFVALPKLSELVAREMEGVVGREPAFESVTGENEPKAPRKEGQEPRTLKEDIDEAQGTWWDAEDLHETTQVFTSHLISTLKAYLRYDIPPGFVTEAQSGDLPSVVQVDSWREALNLIYVEVCAPGTATVYVDPATRDKYALYSYTETIGDGKDKKTRKCVQVSWVARRDDTGAKLGTPITYTLIFKDDDSAEGPFALDTGGVLPIVEAAFHPRVFSAFVNPANVSLNNAINCCSTSIKINVDVAAFPETRHVDIEAPVEEVKDPSAPGGVREEPVALDVGPRRSPFLMSAVDEVADEDTGDISAVPRKGQIFYRAPVSGEPLIQQGDYFKRGLYESVRQAHILNDIAPNASGIARIEAKTDFANSLLKVKPKVEGALRDLLRGVACLAAFLAQDSRIEAFKAARWNVTCHANSGPITPDEKRLVLEMLAAETISRETAMVILGIEDVQAELDKIRVDAEARQFGEDYHPGMEGAKPAATGGDPNALDENGNPVAAGVATDQGLNGAQATALNKALILLSGGFLAEDAVTQELVSLGIDEATAKAMVVAQKAIVLTPDQVAAAGV